MGITDSNGIETYKGIQIFSSNPEGKLGFLDNLVGLYVYKYWPNGTQGGPSGSGTRQDIFCLCNKFKLNDFNT